MNIQILNLHPNFIETDLEKLFAPYGEVSSVQLLRDRLNNRSRGRALVDMPIQRERDNARECLDGMLIMGKYIRVSEIQYLPGKAATSYPRGPFKGKNKSTE